MPIAPVDSHPLPTRGLRSRRLRLRKFLGPFYRVHQTSHDPVYFGGKTNPTYRFDAPAGEYGILYCSTSIIGAAAETLLRSFNNKSYILEAEAAARSMATLTLSVSLVDLTNHHLAEFGCDARLFSETDYSIPRAWAAAFWHNAVKPRPAGLLYNARRDPSCLSAGIFERRTTVGVLETIPLLDARFEKHLKAILRRYSAKLM